VRRRPSSSLRAHWASRSSSGRRGTCVPAALGAVGRPQPCAGGHPARRLPEAVVDLGRVGDRRVLRRLASAQGHRRDDLPTRRRRATRAFPWALRPLGGGERHAPPARRSTPRPPRWSQQVWLREHALAPWVLDVQLNPGGPRRWVFKRDHSVRMLLDEATWVDVDGLRYLRPELVLAHKVLLRRPTDDDDLAAVLPRLDPSARSWLHDYVVRRTPLIRGATRCDRPYGLDSSPPDQRRHGGREGRARHYPAPRREKSVRAG
jgi:hypothetical protein